MPVKSIRTVGNGVVEGGIEGFELGGLGGALAGAMEGMATAVEVTFSCRGGGERVYLYTGSDALATQAGANPSNYSGTRIG
jgi:hypothetical protein